MAMPLTIDIYSDVVCPWCYIGIKKFERGLALAGGATEVAVHWRAFQLDPTIPDGGVDHHENLAAKFGGRDALQAKFDQVREVGRSVGIAFAFDRIKLSPNTLNAHRLIRLAGETSAHLQDTVTKRLFKAYFEEAQDIGDLSVLASLAAECGMDQPSVSEFLKGGGLSSETLAEARNASQMGITGVPCFIFEKRYAVSGAQSPETFANAISQIAEAKAAGMLESAA
jgi:predicted DsbA family dithiol-disulfide isomerase